MHDHQGTLRYHDAFDGYLHRGSFLAYGEYSENEVSVLRVYLRPGIRSWMSVPSSVT